MIRIAATLLFLSSCWIQEAVTNCEVQPKEVICERCRYAGQVIHGDGCTFVCYEEERGPLPEVCEEEAWE